MEEKEVVVQAISKRLEIMCQNYAVLEKAFAWENGLNRHYVAMLYAQKSDQMMGQTEIDQIKATMQTMKEETGAFSAYRGMFRFMLAALLSYQFENSKEQFMKMLVNDEDLKSYGFKNSLYLPVANYTLLMMCKDVADQADVREYIRKAMEIYKEMKSLHPWITSGDDYPLAIMLTKSDYPLERVEAIYKGLNDQGFYKGNSLQLLSHILSFGTTSVEAIVARCLEIKRTLKENKLNLETSYYSALGIMTILDDPENFWLQQVMNVAQELTHTKKYKWLGKGMNVLLASALVTQVWIDDQKAKEGAHSSDTAQLMHTTMSISIETIIAAQTAATMAAISATTAAAASNAT